MGHRDIKTTQIYADCPGDHEATSSSGPSHATGSDSGSNLRKTRTNSNRVKPHSRAKKRPATPHARGLWSRRSRVRVPSLTLGTDPKPPCRGDYRSGSVNGAI